MYFTYMCAVILYNVQTFTFTRKDLQCQICNKNKLFHKLLKVYCCSYVGDGSSIALPTHFFMILVKCKNPSHTLPCGDDFDVMSFILPHVDTMPNCLVSRRLLILLLCLINDITLNSVYSTSDQIHVLVFVYILRYYVSQIFQSFQLT